MHCKSQQHTTPLVIWTSTDVAPEWTSIGFQSTYIIGNEQNNPDLQTFTTPPTTDAWQHAWLVRAQMINS